MYPRPIAPTLIPLALIFIALLLPAGGARAAEAPLLQPGKTTLYQRVLTRPGAWLTETAAPADKKAGRMVNAFSQIYVYERRTLGGQEWLRVGVDAKGGVLG